MKLLILLALFLNLTFSIKGNQLLNSNFKENTYKNLDKIFLSHTNQSENQLNFIKSKVLNCIKQKGKFLDIGPGPALMTKNISPQFKEITVVDPMTTYKEIFNELGYKSYIENFQAVELPCSFDFILCSHVLYHVEHKDWKNFLHKLYNSINFDGKALVVLQSPNGNWSELQKNVNPNFSNTQLIKNALAELNIPFESTKITSYFHNPDYTDFRNLVFSFTIDNCFTPEEFSKFSILEKESIFNKIDKHIASCKQIDGSYLITWEDEYVLIQK